MMPNVRLPVAVCAAAADVLSGSHDSLNALFEAAGAPGPPPNLAHHSKWKTWLQRVGNDPNVDSLAVLGNVIEEFMDLPPLPSEGGITTLLDIALDPVADYNKKRERLVKVFGGSRISILSWRKDYSDWRTHSHKRYKQTYTDIRRRKTILN